MESAWRRGGRGWHRLRRYSRCRSTNPSACHPPSTPPQYSDQHSRSTPPHTDTPVDRVLHVHVDHGVLLSKLVPYRDPLAATPLHLLAMGSERGASFVSFIS